MFGWGAAKWRLVAVAFAAMFAIIPSAVTAPGTASASLAAGSASHVDDQWPADLKGDGCTPPVWPEAPRSHWYRRVLVVGDSLIRQSRPLLEDRLTAAGWLPTVRCWGAKGSDWGVQQIERARELGELPGTVVVSLGTNDIWWLHISMKQAIDSMMAAIGDHKQVYWVNLRFGPTGYADLPSALPANRTLRAATLRYPNLHVVQFSEAFAIAERTQPPVGWLDGVHLNTAGQKVRVDAIVKALGSPSDAPRA